MASAAAAAMSESNYSQYTIEKTIEKNANSESQGYNYEIETIDIFAKDCGGETTIFHVNLGQSLGKPTILTFEMHLNHLFTLADASLTLY